MDTMWSEILDTGNGQQCKFRVDLGLDPPNQSNAIRTIDDIPAHGWINITYLHAGMIIQCQIQPGSIADGYAKALPLRPDGDAGPIVEIALADIGIMPYAIRGHICKWNQDTYAVPAAEPVC